MEKQSEHKSLSVISQVSAVEGCPLSGVSLYIDVTMLHRRLYTLLYYTIDIYL